MQDSFISKIHIDKVRHLENIDIDLSETERKHLILTGKNGSGKTSLLEAMRDYILERQRQGMSHLDNDTSYKETRKIIFPQTNSIPDITITFSKGLENFYNLVFVYIPAERIDFVQPKSIEAFEIYGKTLITNNASQDFLKYILNLYVQYLSAKDSERPEAEIKQYKAWFDRFTEALRGIYNCHELEIKPDMRKLEFLIVMPGREPFGLHQMSDGYKAFIEIYMELLMRFETNDGLVDYNQSAIAIIDEIEHHLHVELQKRALPFLTKMFPKVQFIVSTHSPFVISSLSNAVVYDLEKRERLDNPSYFSYETIVESFLGTDMYSEELKRRFNRYKELCFKKRTAEENKEFVETKMTLERMVPASKELMNAFYELEQQRKAAANDKA